MDAGCSNFLVLIYGEPQGLPAVAVSLQSGISAHFQITDPIRLTVVAGADRLQFGIYCPGNQKVRVHGHRRDLLQFRNLGMHHRNGVYIIHSDVQIGVNFYVHYPGMDGTVGDPVSKLEREWLIPAKLECFQLRGIRAIRRHYSNQGMEQFGGNHG